MDSAVQMPRSRYAARLGEFPDIVLAGSSAFAQRGRWAALFRNRLGLVFTGRIILEIGCSNARYLSEIAGRHTETAFVGIDWKCKAIHDGAKHIQVSGTRNVVLLHTRGHDLLKLFTSEELDEIWIFHPDPCDTKGTLPNRLVGRDFLLQASAALKGPTSLLALKTDHRDYYQSVLDLFVSDRALLLPADDSPAGGRFQIAMQATDYWHDPIALAHTENLFFAKTTTPFETRYIKKHLPICYLELRKNQASAKSQ
jgi:tRNA G46 methylase TrmB